MNLDIFLQEILQLKGVGVCMCVGWGVNTP